MTLKSRFHSWMCVWLSCVLAVMLPSAPLMASWVQEEVRSESSEPVENEPTEVADDVTLSHSRSEPRRAQYLRARFRSSTLQKLQVRLAQLTVNRLGGQGSHAGRSPPLHC